MEPIRFVVPGVPVPQGSMKGFVVGGRAIVTSDNVKLRPWRAVIALAAQSHAPETPLTGALSVQLAFGLPVPKSAPKRRRLEAVKRPDIDKLSRSVLDACKGILWADDAQIVRLEAHKFLAYDAAPGLSVTVFDLAPVTI